MSINERLAEIQAELKAPKGQINKFGGYRYRSCEDILTAVKPLLKGLTLMISDDVVAVGDRVYVKATAILSDGENVLASTAYAREPADKKGMDASQITGAASSYARKYALNGLLAIDDTADADATNDHAEKPVDLDAVRAKLKAAPEDVATKASEWVAKKYGSLEKMPPAAVDALAKRLEAA